MLQISLRTRIARGLRLPTIRREVLRSYKSYTSRCSRSRRQHLPHLGALLLRLSTELDSRVPHLQMLTVNITRSTNVHVLHAIKCEDIFPTIFTKIEYHSSSSNGKILFKSFKDLSLFLGQRCPSPFSILFYSPVQSLSAHILPYVYRYISICIQWA